MNIQIRKFYYGDIPDENAGGTELEDSNPPPLRGVGGLLGHYGKFLFVANKGLTINMLAVFMQQMRKWQLRMQGMFIPEEWKV